MLPKRLIVKAVAAIAFALSGASFAETAAGPNSAAAAQAQPNAAADTAYRDAHGAAQDMKDTKVDEATAADAKYHGNRTEANRQARDKAESDAAEAIGRANSMQQPASR